MPTSPSLSVADFFVYFQSFEAEHIDSTIQASLPKLEAKEWQTLFKMVQAANNDQPLIEILRVPTAKKLKPGATDKEQRQYYAKMIVQTALKQFKLAIYSKLSSLMSDVLLNPASSNVQLNSTSSTIRRNFIYLCESKGITKTNVNQLKGSVISLLLERIVTNSDAESNDLRVINSFMNSFISKAYSQINPVWHEFWHALLSVVNDNNANDIKVLNRELADTAKAYKTKSAEEDQSSTADEEGGAVKLPKSRLYNFMTGFGALGFGFIPWVNCHATVAEGTAALGAFSKNISFIFGMFVKQYLSPKDFEKGGQVTDAILTHPLVENPSCLDSNPSAYFARMAAPVMKKKLLANTIMHLIDLLIRQGNVICNILQHSKSSRTLGHKIGAGLKAFRSKLSLAALPDTENNISTINQFKAELSVMHRHLIKVLKSGKGEIDIGTIKAALENLEQAITQAAQLMGGKQRHGFDVGFELQSVLPLFDLLTIHDLCLSGVAFPVAQSPVGQTMGARVKAGQGFNGASKPVYTMADATAIMAFLDNETSNLKASLDAKDITTQKCLVALTVVLVNLVNTLIDRSKFIENGVYQTIIAKLGNAGLLDMVGSVEQMCAEWHNIVVEALSEQTNDKTIAAYFELLKDGKNVLLVSLDAPASAVTP